MQLHSKKTRDAKLSRPTASCNTTCVRDWGWNHSFIFAEAWKKVRISMLRKLRVRNYFDAFFAHFAKVFLLFAMTCLSAFLWKDEFSVVKFKPSKHGFNCHRHPSWVADGGRKGICAKLLLFIRVKLHFTQPRAGSGVVRMDPLRFLAGCRTRRLNQA